jgi:putative endonuclease
MIGWLLRLADAARHRARSRRWTATQAAGRRGEDLAHRYLEQQGMRVVARNWRAPGSPGEIDVIARDGDTLVFVEVKSRESQEFGAPDRNVGFDKEEALRRVAWRYAHRAGVEWSRVRFDVVGVVLGDPPAIEHRRNAFPARRKL